MVVLIKSYLAFLAFYILIDSIARYGLLEDARDVAGIYNSKNDLFIIKQMNTLYF